MAFGMSFELKVPVNDYRQMVLALSPSLMQKMLYQAGTTARRAGVTRIGKVVSQQFNRTSAQVKGEVRNPAAEPPKLVNGNAVIRITMNTQPRSLRQWGFFDNGRGVYGYIERGVKLRWHKSFQLEGEKGKAAGATGSKGLIWTRYEGTRLPLGVPMGPTVGAIMLGKGRYSNSFQEEVVERVNEQWMKGFEQAYKRYFS